MDPKRLPLLTSDLQVHRAVHGQRQGQEVEGVESGTDVATRLALHLGLELPVKQVHDDGAIPTQVVFPCLNKSKRTTKKRVSALQFFS